MKVEAKPTNEFKVIITLTEDEATQLQEACRFAAKQHTQPSKWLSDLASTLFQVIADENA